MKLLRRLVAIVVYAALLLPTSDYRLTSWMRAVEVTSTALDKTLRRRRSKIENERLVRHVAALHQEEDEEETTLRRAF